MSKLNELKSKFVGSRLTEIICGGRGNGSVIILISETQVSLKVQSVWRLTDTNEVLASWCEEDNSRNSNFVLQVEKLEGDKIISFETSVFYDVTILFESGKRLFILSDINKHYSDDDFDENWVL